MCFAINVKLDEKVPLAIYYSEEGMQICAFPSKIKGQIQLINLDDWSKENYTIPAHNSEISSVFFNSTGTLLATTSIKGTLIRVFECIKCSNGHCIISAPQLKYEFRRGSEQAQIYNISFSQDNKYLAVSSETGTIHIFKLNFFTSKENTGDFLNKTNAMALPEQHQANIFFSSRLLPKYLRSIWSFSQAKVPPKIENILHFGLDNNLTVISFDGLVYKFAINHAKGGDCIQLTRQQFYFPTTFSGNSKTSIAVPPPLSF